MTSAPQIPKTFVFSSSAVPTPQKPPDPHGGSTAVAGKNVSFRDMLTAGKELPKTREKTGLIATRQVKLTHEGGNRLLPRIMIDENYFKELCYPWKDAPCGEIAGEDNRVQYHERKTGEDMETHYRDFEIMDVNNGFYMVKCDLPMDRERIISEGLWMIYDHYLAVAQWSPKFSSPHTKVKKTMVWIRFPGHNLLYYDESFLLALATTVGTLVKVDSNTLKVERGRFARICVEIDLTKPVVGKVCINDDWYKVQYEGLHIICASCHRRTAQNKFSHRRMRTRGRLRQLSCDGGSGRA